MPLFCQVFLLLSVLDNSDYIIRNWQAPQDKWMTMPDMGFFIAQKYNHTLVLLSIEKGRFETFFPLWGEPPFVERLMCMANMNDNHFMIIHLKKVCPIPPTCPLWMQHVRDDALS